MRIAALLILCLLLAGCSSTPSDPETQEADDDGAPAQTDDTQDTGEDDDTGEPSPTPPPALTNEPPVANLTASGYQGPAPYDTTLIVAATDADGDDLSFLLSFGDGSEDATGSFDGSIQVNHTFGEEGLYAVSLEVSDGTIAVSANVTVDVTSAAAAASAETFYLHSADIAEDGILDHIPADASEAAHGTVSFGTGTADGYQQAFVATEGTLSPHLAGSAILVHIQGFTLSPDPTVKANVVLKAGDAQVGSGSSPTATSASVGLVTTPCVDLVVPITPSADIPAGAILRVEVDVDSASVFAPCFPGGENGPRVILA